MPEHLWFAPPPDLGLSGDGVHVWRASLELPAARVGQLAKTLAEDERDRANRFHQERDRRRFVVGRGVLRTILGRYLGVEPSRIRLRPGTYGKPGLDPRAADKDVRFNLTHSQDLALYAFAQGRELGIDLEQIRPLPDADQIAAEFFSPRESAAYRALLPEQRQGAFFRCWTRKEAYIKALGGGLALPLDQFDVSLAPEEHTQLLHVAWDSKEVSRWSLVTLEPAPGYVSTLAVEGRDWRLALWHFGWPTPT